MTLPEFAAAVFLLLLVPGPTNLMLAVCGSAHGLARGLPLIIAVAGGYLTTVLILLAFAAPVMATHPLMARLVALAASGWVLWLALRLWRGGGREIDAGGAATTGSGDLLRLYTTTVLNPKGLVIGLALLPALPISALLPWLATLLGMTAGVSLGWLALGAIMLRSLGTRHPLLVTRGAAGTLVFFAAGLAGRAAGWM